MGPRIVPIVADEARTFGMANLFRQIGIYSAQGQLYEPEDIGSVLYYREAHDGQILEEGITEAGAISSWTAAGTSYSVNGLPMLPFYIYYSMFGFQRIGDLIWAAADQRTRGFLVGATSGRTTLGGEGLQHQDGSSHLTAATVPNCRAYDPAYAYEVAVIVEYGMRRMLDEQHDEFFYLTVTNENLAQPDMPADPAARAGILRGLYRLRPARGQAQVRLLGSGPMLREAELAADRLRDEYGVDAEVWSVTSYSELARDGREAERARCCLPAARMPTGSGPAWAPARPRDRRQRLRARRARTDPRLGARALPHAGHRRFRPQRHAGAAARLLRGRPRLDRAASAGQPGTRGRRPGAARAAGRGNAPDAALGAVKHGEAAAPLRHGRLPPPIPHRPVPGSRSAVGRVPGRHYRLSSPPFLSRPARSPNRADFPPRSRAGLIKVHPESAARCGAASARARFLVKYGRSQAFPQRIRGPQARILFPVSVSPLMALAGPIPMDDTLAKLALDYHAYPTPGKISVTPTKTLANQDDLSLAYSPGVAAACMAIFDQGDDAASKYTSRGNLVGVITNGTAVLGLGNIGPLAAKPVMEGKGCLFKKFAGIDVFDIELAENDPDKLVDIIAALEPTLGGVNLEDIKAPGASTSRRSCASA